MAESSQLQFIYQTARCKEDVVHSVGADAVVRGGLDKRECGGLAAKRGTGFHDMHVQPGSGELARGGQTVVAAPITTTS